MTDHPHRPIHHRLMAIFLAPVAHWHHGRYQGRPWHLTIDTFLNLIIWTLISAITIYLVAQPFSATVKINWVTTPLVSGANSEWALKVENSGHRSLKNLGTDVRWPANWQTFSDDLTIANINGGETRTSQYSFRPVDRPDGRYAVPVTVSWQVWWQHFSTTTVARGKINGTVIDLRLTSNPTATSGGQFTTRVNVKNTAATDVTNVQIKLSPPTGPSVVSSNQAVTDYTWSIENIAGHQEKTWDVTWRVPTAPRRSYRLVATALISKVGQVSRSVDVLVSAVSGEQLAKTTVLTQPAVSAELRYRGASGAQFGFGPLPPRVGEETGYRIFWYVRPGSQALTNNTVTAVLPAGVIWLGHPSVTSGSSITYNAKTRRITWLVGELSAGGNMVVGGFDVAVIPGKAMIGKSINICGAATWSYTGQGTSRLMTGGLKSTDVDGRAAGKGLVKS
jgi:hypothetical protein